MQLRRVRRETKIKHTHTQILPGRITCWRVKRGVRGLEHHPAAPAGGDDRLSVCVCVCVCMGVCVCVKTAKETERERNREGDRSRERGIEREKEREGEREGYLRSLVRTSASGYVWMCAVTLE